MQKIIDSLNKLPPFIHSPELEISDRCMVYYRREIERAKRATGLTCEIIARDFTRMVKDGEDIITLTTILTDINLEKAVLVASEFKSRLIATAVSPEIWLVKCQPRIVYHTGKAVNNVFQKLKDDAANASN